MSRINILQYIEGAKKAEGLTVIIDVFRAFSLECYLYDMGVKEIRPVGSIEEAFRLKETIENSLLIGERRGKMCEGFDYGNSPSSVSREKVEGKTIIHTTSAGTQGIVNATGASEIITGSLVNARAVAEYIKSKNPEVVSLVCMGNNGVTQALEDELCAEYIKSILEGNELQDMKARTEELQFTGGKHFFDEAQKEVFPTADFWMCIQYNKFPFVIGIEKDELGNVAFMAKAEFPLGITAKVNDAQGNEIGYVNREFAFMPTFELYQRDLCVGVLHRTSLWKQSYEVDYKNWHVEGDFFGWDYRILDGAGQCVAEMSKEIVNLQDTYAIDVRNTEDALIVLMVVLAIDMEKASRN